MSYQASQQVNKGNIDRERFSSFVVDLRQNIRQTEKKIESEVATIIKPKKNRLLSKKTFLSSSPASKSNIFTFKRSAKVVTKAPGEILAGDFIWKWPKSRSAKKYRQSLFNYQRRILSQPAKIKKILFPHKDLLKNKSHRLRRAEDQVFWYRSLFSFAFILLLIIVPFKLLSYLDLFNVRSLENKILGHSQLAFTNLLAAVNSVSDSDFYGASSQFEQAGRDFLAAQEDLNKINDSLLSLASLTNDPKLRLASESKKFLNAGVIASSLGRNLVLATDSLFKQQNQATSNFSENLNNFSVSGQAAVADALALKKELAKINPDNLPENYRLKFISLSGQVTLLADSLEDFIGAANKLQEILGLSQDKRYLLVFQNNSELRASGGFLGSYALMDIKNGKIKNLEVPGGGSYDTEAGLKTLVRAPEPLWLVNPLWHFWDANWWPDWPTTAQNLIWFYGKSGGPSVDGVISVTPTVMERLLEITGPIDLTAEYGLVIDSHNFLDTVQKVVEQKNILGQPDNLGLNLPSSSVPIKSALPLKQDLENNASNKPKKIIGDLMAKIMEVLPSKLSKENLVQILALLESSLSEKQILFYFNNPDLQAEVSSRNYAGEVKDTDKDYLLVVDTNIAGQKSDKKITERIEHYSEVQSSGAIINTLKIYRTHTGLKNEPFSGVRNVDWLRVYVPSGSELISANGFLSPEAKYLQDRPSPDWVHVPYLKNEEEAVLDKSTGTKIYTENNKTVFANWTMVDPGETAVITITYRLPFNFFAVKKKESWLKRWNELLNPGTNDLLAYSLLVQKQPGSKNNEFASSLILPSDYQVFWRYPDNLIGTQGWEVKEDLKSDKYYSILLNKP